MIGGPPCQSWSEAGAHRGIEDKRGRLFHEYVRLIEAKQPLFFVAENVSGILSKRHDGAFQRILESFTEIGYNVSYGLLNANDYGVPQDRERVIIVGYQTQVGKFFLPPSEAEEYVAPVLKDAIWDLRKTAKPAKDGNRANSRLAVANHEYLVMDYSPMFMSRNRVRGWNEPSFTVQASGRQAPLHPQAPPMTRLSAEKREFVRGKENLYRRLTVREAARVQTFPDDHVFLYDNVSYGYKMIGNAVPVEFARRLALQIKEDLNGHTRTVSKKPSVGVIRTYAELRTN
jgi:DNA (cytosine-5)-methyltransferase 1